MAKAKKVAQPPKAGHAGKKEPAKKDWKGEHAHLFNKDARDFRIGRDVQPKRNLSRFVKWPRYVRLQRERAILNKRLKVPPAIFQFSRTLDKNHATTLLKLLAYYRPETREQKKKRIAEKAQAEAKQDKTEKKAEGKPITVKYGINHIVNLVEKKKAKLVVIAHDVDPIELVVCIPALCRKMDVPYCIVKGKARLGQLVHKKTATALCITEVKKEDQHKLDQLVGVIRPQYNESVDALKRWGGGIMGVKAQAVVRAREKQAARDAAKAK